VANLRLLVVDDDDLIRDALTLSSPPGWDVTCIEKLRDADIAANYHAALVDMHLTPKKGAEGLEVIKKLVISNPHLEVVAMSGDLDRNIMEKCLKVGASRFLAKPINPDELALILGKIESLHLLQSAALRSQSKKQMWIGDGEASQVIKRKIAALRGEAGTVLISGETGTGKEVVAHLVKNQISDGPFVTLNVAAIPENLFESELFGHTRGAFTGADQNKMGLAEVANTGVLFIDEIEALSMPVQVKLLRFLESGEIKRVGAKENIQVNCKVIVATNRSLDEMVKSGEFREDLLWRIKSNFIELPPLRTRKEDIPALCKHFLKRDRIRHKSLEEDALESFVNYDWPGNVRELKRYCEHLIVNAPLPIIRAEDVIPLLSTQRSAFQTLESINLSEGLTQVVAQYEAQVIAKTLEEYKDIDIVTKLLKISRSSLYKKIKDFGIEWRH